MTTFLGWFKSGGGRLKVILKSPKSGCGKSMVDFTRKRKMNISNSSLNDQNFKDPTIMKQSPTFIRNFICRKKRHGFHNLTNALTMCIENRLHKIALIGGLDERTVNEKCAMVDFTLEAKLLTNETGNIIYLFNLRKDIFCSFLAKFITCAELSELCWYCYPCWIISYISLPRDFAYDYTSTFTQ